VHLSPTCVADSLVLILTTVCGPSGHGTTAQAWRLSDLKQKLAGPAEAGLGQQFRVRPVRVWSNHPFTGLWRDGQGRRVRACIQEGCPASSFEQREITSRSHYEKSARIKGRFG
jgi:hypothetical protein